MTKRKAILEVLKFCRGCLGLCSNKYNFQRWKGGEQGSKGEAGGALSGPHLQPPLYHVCLFDYEKWMCNVYSSDSPTCVCGSNGEIAVRCTSLSLKLSSSKAAIANWRLGIQVVREKRDAECVKRFELEKGFVTLSLFVHYQILAVVFIF